MDNGEDDVELPSQLFTHYCATEWRSVIESREETRLHEQDISPQNEESNAVSSLAESRTEEETVQEQEEGVELPAERLCNDCVSTCESIYVYVRGLGEIEIGRS